MAIYLVTLYILTRFQMAVIDFEFSIRENVVVPLKPIVKRPIVLHPVTFDSIVCSFYSDETVL